MNAHATLRGLRRAALGLAAVASIGGCQTVEYGPLGGKPIARYAYRETAMSATRYVLVMRGPAGAEMSTMQSMWTRRAQELCGDSAFTSTLYRAERPTMTYGYYGGNPGLPELEGFLDCAAAPPSAGGGDALKTR
jgi:hypothetical protein